MKPKTIRHLLPRCAGLHAHCTFQPGSIVNRARVAVAVVFRSFERVDFSLHPTTEAHRQSKTKTNVQQCEVRVLAPLCFCI